MTALQGKTAIVTGAGRGIGLSTVRALTAQGAHVVGAARTPTEELRAAAGSTHALDLADPSGADQLVARTLDERGRIDVLVNNVGAFTARTDGFAAITDAQWLESLQVNFLSAVRCIRAALPSLIEYGGAIVNVGSINARMPQPPVVDYAAAKAALVNLATTLAQELGPQGVRVNTVSPGPTLTPAWQQPDGFGAALAADSGQPLDAFLEDFPANAGLSTGRMTDPDEVAALVALLASGEIRNANGSEFVIDGGQDTTL